MAIAISSFLTKSTPSIHFLMMDTDLRGGFRVVADQTARDAIPMGARTAGMLVYQVSNATMYQLVGGTANANFQVFDVTANVAVGSGLSNDGSVISVDTAHLNSLYSQVGHAHAIADVTNLQTTLDGKAASAHTHPLSNITDVAVASVADKNLLQYNSATSKWENKTLAAAGVAATSHNHAIADVTNLQTTLDGKAASVHTHAIADTTGLQTALDSKAAVAHNHVINDVTGLQSTLDGKAAAVHSHAISDVTNLQTTLDGKAASVHTHAIADTTGLQAALDSKSPTTHNHTIDSLTNVAVATKADKDLLQWNSVSSKWENKTLANAGVAAAVHAHAISDVTNLQSTLDSKSSTTHTHAFAELTAVPKVTAMPGVTISSAEPTAAQGTDGDLWFVIP